MNKKILYITSSLPSVTLTFIYREIDILSKSGYDISTISRLKPEKDSVSEEALHLYKSTLYLDQESLLKKILCQMHIFYKKPIIFLKALILALTETEVQSYRDKFRLIKQLIDAGYAFAKLKDKDYHQIHAHFLSGPTTVALFLSQYLGIPFSFTMHASLIFVDPIMLRTKLDMCKRAVTVSDYNRHYLENKYGGEITKKIDIIHCGIDIGAFEPTDDSKPSPPIILAVGQLVERKGFLYLVDAFKILKEKNIQFTGYIVGDGDQMNSLKERIKKYGIGKVVHLLGRQPQERVRELLNKASIFTLPSIVTDFGGREGIPVALMEAMAMKIPVVSTKSVGIPELVEHGKEGLLVSERETDQLAIALEKLISDPKTRNKMGEEAAKKVSNEFNLSNIPTDFERIFN